jgi:hypothetical protein
MTPIYVASEEGHIEVVRELEEWFVDMECCTLAGDSPLNVALLTEETDIVDYLVGEGVDIRRCLTKLTDDEASYLSDIFHEYKVSMTNHGACPVESNNAENNLSMICFSLTKLMNAVVIKDCRVHDPVPTEVPTEFTIAVSVRHAARNGNIDNFERMQSMYYARRRRLVRVAFSVYKSMQQQDSHFLDDKAKARSYTDLVCFFLDSSALNDVYVLRLTCKSNNERRRFPVNFSVYKELEANIIEEWLGYGSDCCSRFASTEVIAAALAIHEENSPIYSK